MMTLGFMQCDAIIKDFQSELDEQEALIIYNRHREKTMTMLFAEAEELRGITTRRSEARKQSTQFNGKTEIGEPKRKEYSVPEIFPEPKKGETRDIIAQKIGADMCGRQLERGMKIHEAAKSGNEIAQEEGRLQVPEGQILSLRKYFRNGERGKPVTL